MPKKGRKGASVRGGRLRFSHIVALIPAVVFIGLIVFLFLQPAAQPPITKITSSNEGGEAPDFVLRRITPNGLSDETFILSSTRGRVVFLDFAWWRCPHCNNMEPVIRDLYSEFSSRGVVFVTVLLDDRQSSISDSARFVAQHEIPWTALWDEGGRVFDRYGVTGTPTYVIINEEGRIVRVLTGEQPKQVLADILSSVLR
ncbi:Thiol-disulfide oxidoreductase ResA [Candidatus Calditenuaceae archaeon HR02]|nr:Thiol-disulfide oxidoreductase ResA [Candidatus Calditenuaceae archaeon HR02]